ncbi:hypothetical protein HRI_001711600 [Hibiscus trionum]|uniref:Hydrophobic seed protein domain-containing protein n=1 Tax=Hibiscus trionum TaxID=183268 RepID=A0A9W7HN56_HIBTR|nr:hypothetical protein HRI_001711600 [Hibiscus trionum]
MASSVKASTVLFLSLNIVFFALVSSHNVDSCTTNSRNPVVIRPGDVLPNGRGQSERGSGAPGGPSTNSDSKINALSSVFDGPAKDSEHLFPFNTSSSSNDVILPNSDESHFLDDENLNPDLNSSLRHSLRQGVSVNSGVFPNTNESQDVYVGNSIDNFQHHSSVPSTSVLPESALPDSAIQQQQRNIPTRTRSSRQTQLPARLKDFQKSQENSIVGLRFQHNLLSLVDVELGNVPTKPCCSLIEGLLDLEAAVCLCTAVRANVLGININLPISLNLFLNNCGRRVPAEYICNLM